MILQRHGLWTRQNILPELDKIQGNQSSSTAQPVIVTSSDKSVDDSDSVKPRKISMLSLRRSFKNSFRGSRSSSKKKRRSLDIDTAADADDEGGTLRKTAICSFWHYVCTHCSKCKVLKIHRHGWSKISLFSQFFVSLLFPDYALTLVSKYLTWPLSHIIVGIKGNPEVIQKKILLPNVCVPTSVKW